MKLIIAYVRYQAISLLILISIAVLYLCYLIPMAQSIFIKALSFLIQPRTAWKARSGCG